MTCGIYKLKFYGTDSVYIGQSQNVEYRYSQHLNYLLRGVNSKKLQKAYSEFGTPVLEILLECGIDELDSAENEAIQIYDSFNRGFNSLAEARDIPRLVGEAHPGSKYTNEAIEAAFILLCDSVLTHKQISEMTGVSKNMVNHIAAGTCHAWLSKVHPDKYTTLIKNKPIAGNSAERGKVYPPIQDPNGNQYHITNLREFSRQHNLPYSSLNYLVNGKTKHVKNWVLVTEYKCKEHNE